VARDPAFSKIDVNWFGQEVHGGTLGIVGMGAVGQQIARRAIGFDMKVIYHNRRRAPPEVEAACCDAEYVSSLGELLGRSDFVVLSCPATPETYKMMSSEEFALMKSTSVFVNVGRGSLVDQEALELALKRGVIRSAAVDVTDPEPLPRDHPLLSTPNLIILPHVGTATLATRARMLAMVRVWLACPGQRTNTQSPHGAAVCVFAGDG
jgi:glyoxylate reductase